MCTIHFQARLYAGPLQDSAIYFLCPKNSLVVKYTVGSTTYSKKYAWKDVEIRYIHTNMKLIDVFLW